VAASYKMQSYLVCKAVEKYNEGEYFLAINNILHYLGTDAKHAFDISYKTLNIDCLIKFNCNAVFMILSYASNDIVFIFR
jgi:hypothetical protein